MNTYQKLSRRLVDAVAFGRKCSSLNSDLELLKVLHNRNPRNLEKCRIDLKPRGFMLDTPSREYWHKLNFLPTTRHTKGYVQHNNGCIIISAATTEWCIRKHLNNTRDIQAASIIGAVLGRRCLFAGIIEVFASYSDEERKKSDKLNYFLDEFSNAGVKLKESERFYTPHPFDQVSLPSPFSILEEDVPEKIPDGIKEEDVCYIYRGFTVNNPKRYYGKNRVKLRDQLKPPLLEKSYQ